jgi:hypothetical protein
MKKACLGILLLMAGAGLAGAQDRAVIREVNGTVEVKAPGAAAWERAAAGRELAAATLVSTGFGSTALIMIGDSLVMVRPLTRLSLEEIAADRGGGRVTLNLRAGRVRADVKPPEGGQVRFSVRSPIATASVRGTAFEFDGMQVRVDEGRVYLGGENLAGAYVGAGHSSAVDAGSAAAVAAAEALEAELAPPPLAGEGPGPELPAAAPSASGLGIGIGW